MLIQKLSYCVARELCGGFCDSCVTRIVGLLIIGLMLSGCASNVDLTVRSQIDNAEVDTKAAQNQLSLKQGKQIFVIDEILPKFASRTVPIGPSTKLPQVGIVTVRYAGRHSLVAAADIISRTVNIPIVISPDALTSPSEPSPAKLAPPSTPDIESKAATKMVSASVASDNDILSTIELNYTGELAGLLDQITKRGRLNWRFEDGVVTISRLVRRTFIIKAMPSVTETKGDLSMNPGAGASASMSVVTESKVNVAAQIKAALDTMLSKSGVLQFDAANGTVHVIDSIDNVIDVERYIDRINNSMLRQVALSVQVLQVALDESNERGIDWNAVSRMLSSNGRNSIGLAIGGPSLAIPSTTNSGLSFQLIPNSKGESTANAFVKALETFGRVSSSYTSTVTTMNRQSVPLGVLNQLTYVKQVSPSTSDGAGAVVAGPTITPGQISTGFTMNVTPVVLDSNRVMVEVLLSISRLRELKTFTSGTGTSQASVQTPDVDIFSTMQRANMMAGHTMVIAGYESESGNANGQDTIRNLVPGFRVSKRQRISTVVLITPRLDTQ